VNAVAPGAIATSALDIVLTNDELHDAMVAATPLRRLGEAIDIAAAAVYLASPASAYVTGDVIRVDGGIQGPNLELGIPDL
jgi:7-alpha-hydroxysteroid dehydrogenase